MKILSIFLLFFSVAKAGYVDSGNIQCTIGPGTVSSPSLIGNFSGSSQVPTAYTPSVVLDDSFGSTQGNILYRGASVWSALSPGLAGQCLESGGPSSNPSWGYAVTAASSPLSISTNTISLSGIVPVGNGGSGTSTSFTQGSVIFSGASGIYNQNNSNLFWDNTNYRLGIGTSVPDSAITINQTSVALPSVTTGIISQIHMAGANGVASTLFSDSFANTGQIIMRRADGTAAAPTAVQSGDILMNILSIGYGATSYQTSAPAKIVSSAAENFTDSTGAAILQFFTRPSGTISVSTERVRIDQNGKVGIGTTTPGASLDVSGSIRASTSITNSSLTLGSVLFAGAAGLESQNNSNLFWDNTNYRLGIGTATPAQSLDLGTTGVARVAQTLGSSSTPTVAYGSASGTGAATVALIGNQMAFYLQYTTGTSTTTGTLFTITNPVASGVYGCVPVLVPQNAAAAAVSTRIGISLVSTSSWSASVFTSGLTAGTAYAWYVSCPTSF